MPERRPTLRSSPEEKMYSEIEKECVGKQSEMETVNESGSSLQT